jgi:tetratricopeptide (TPR) repeat protein
MPQPATTDASDNVSELAAANQHNLRRLVLSVRASLHKLNLLIAICDNPLYRDELIRTYEAELTANGITCYQVQLDRQQPSLKQSLLDWQAHTSDWQSDIPKLVTVRGGDELLGVRLQQAKSAQEKFFFSVQWTRESLREFRFPIVLWVTEAVAQGLAQQAKDFWSWRGGVFEFVQPMAWQMPDQQPSVTSPRPEAAESDLLADPAELEQQIAALQATDPDSPLLDSLYQSLGETYDKRLERGIAVDRPQEEARAIAAFQAAIARRQSLSDPIPLATSLSYLAELYRSQGRYAEAEPLYRRALQITEQQLGAEHPDTATSLNNLAGLYRSQGRYAEAEPLYRRALQITEQQLGAEHPDTATSLNNLAGLYRSQGRYAEAEPLYRRALQIREQQLGAEHPAIATGLNNLGLLYYYQGRYGEAESLLLRARAIDQQILGEKHLNLAIDLHNLALVYKKQKRYSEAEQLFTQALQLKRQALPELHPLIADTLYCLGSMYRDQGNYWEAKVFSQQALNIDLTLFGKKSPKVADDLRDLALIEQARGSYEEAESLLADSLAICEQTLGANHPQTLETQQDLAILRQAMNKN